MLNSPNVEHKELSLAKYAMNYGAILGLFWVLKYLLLMGEVFSDRFKYLYYVLNVGTFLLIYVFNYKFKESGIEHAKKISKGILFTISLCFFASFFEVAIMYAHYKFIDPAYFSKITEPFLVALNKMEKPASVSDDEYFRSKEIVKGLFMNETVHIIARFIENLFLGLFLGISMSLIITNKKK